MDKMKVNEKELDIIKLLGKGKGGYSYLASDGENLYVLKQIHHEPCDYYQFGNKIEAEINDYQRLKEIGIRIPKMLDVDIDKERILKEFVDGDTIDQLVLKDEMKQEYLQQIKDMCGMLYPKNTNIDYFPTNFVVQEGLIYYIDYECNDYMEEWNFENWGIKYWSKTEEFMEYFKTKK
jgi:TP53 regulating kinase and related kinases